MVKSWAAIGCTKRQGGRVIFHIFPVGKFRQKQWLAVTETCKSTCLEVCSSMFRPLPWCVLCKESQTTVRITWGTANHKVIWKFRNIAQHLSCANTLDTCVTMKEGLNKNNTSMYITNHPDSFSIWFYLKLAVLQILREMIDVPSTDSYFLGWLTSVSWDLDV